jgi:Trypsin-like peptidase domain
MRLALLPLVLLAAGPLAAEEPAAPGVGQFVQEFTPSLVFIEGGGGAGSGFICKMSDGIFVCTNQHVVAGMPTVRITRLDNARVAPGVAQAAIGHDLMRFATADAPRPLVAMANVEAEARIGDDVFVLGNSEGARVIQPLSGKLLGIGPDRIEVSAPFVPGNSGSPIIHARTGRVIGIAAYLAQRRYSEYAGHKDTTVRRFGYRLDSVRQWQPVSWPVFQSERAELEKVARLTLDFARLIAAIRDDASVDPAQFASGAVARPVREYVTTMARRGLSTADRQRAVNQLLASLRGATQGDIVQARARFRYDFFQRALGEEAETRTEMQQLFDRLLKK